MGVEPTGFLMDELTKIRKAVMAKKEKEPDKIRYSSGCTLLDLSVGGSKGVVGFEGGKWLNLVGDTQSGKSALCVEMCAANKYRYKDDCEIFYDDSEDGLTFDTDERYGFSTKPSWGKNSETVEEMCAQFTKFLTENKEAKHLYITDSLDGLAGEADVEYDNKRQKAFEKDKEFTDGYMGLSLPSFLSKQFFKLKHGLLDDTQAFHVITSQVRYNVSGGIYAPKFIRAGGKALDMYANYIIWLRTMQTIEVNGKAIGAVVEAKIKKAKVERPYRTVIYTVLYAYGIDDVGSNIDFLFDLRSDKTGELLKRADSIEWADGVPAMNREELITYIEENHLKKELVRRVQEKWEAEEDAIAIKRPPKYGLEEE